MHRLVQRKLRAWTRRLRKSTWPDCVRRRGWDPSQKVAGPDEGQVDSMRQETCTRLVQEAACEDAVAAYVDAAGFLFSEGGRDVQSNLHDRCGTKPHDDAEYEFKGVNDKSKEDEDLHNEWKYNHMISDELTTTENAKSQRRKVQGWHNSQKRMACWRRTSQQASPSFTNRGEKRRMPIVKSFRLRDESCAAQDEDNSWLHQGGYHRRTHCIL